MGIPHQGAEGHVKRKHLKSHPQPHGCFVDATMGGPTYSAGHQLAWTGMHVQPRNEATYEYSIWGAARLHPERVKAKKYDPGQRFLHSAQPQRTHNPLDLLPSSIVVSSWAKPTKQTTTTATQPPRTPSRHNNVRCATAPPSTRAAHYAAPHIRTHSPATTTHSQHSQQPHWQQQQQAYVHTPDSPYGHALSRPRTPPRTPLPCPSVQLPPSPNPTTPPTATSGPWFSPSPSPSPCAWQHHPSRPITPSNPFPAPTSRPVSRGIGFSRDGISEMVAHQHLLDTLDATDSTTPRHPSPLSRSISPHPLVRNLDDSRCTTPYAYSVSNAGGSGWRTPTATPQPGGQSYSSPGAGGAGGGGGNAHLWSVWAPSNHVPASHRHGAGAAVSHHDGGGLAVCHDELMQQLEAALDRFKTKR